MNRTDSPWRKWPIPTQSTPRTTSWCTGLSASAQAAVTSTDLLLATTKLFLKRKLYENKIKKSEENFILELKKTKDILAFLGEKKRKNQFICGFSMETENLIENSRKKLIKKNVNMIVANNLNNEGAGFGVDTNLVTIITEKKETTLPLMDKDKVANEILNNIIKKF